MEVPDALSSSFRWHFRTALIHRRGSDSEKRKKSIRQAPTNLPPHQTRGEVWFNCHPPARASSRSPILVGIYLEAPVLKQTCTHVQVCAQRLFFWTVHSPFSFRLAEKKMGGGLPRHHHGTIFRPIGTAPGGTPRWNRFVKSNLHRRRRVLFQRGPWHCPLGWSRRIPPRRCSG